MRTRTAAGGAGDLATFDPVAHVDTITADLDSNEPDVAYIRSLITSLREPFDEAVAVDPLGHGVVHGDLHFGNVVVAEEGPLLTDLELGGWGGASYDTAAAVVAVRRYGAPEGGLERFIDAAGADPREWPGFATYVAVYELWLVAWAVSVAHRKPAWATEAAKRVASLRDGTGEIWQLS